MQEILIFSELQFLHINKNDFSFKLILRCTDLLKICKNTLKVMPEMLFLLLWTKKARQLILLNSSDLKQCKESFFLFYT